MLHFARWKILSILAICLLGLLLPIPSFLSEATYKKLPSWAQHRINLGLDLRGGAHLLFEMDTAEIKKNWLATLRQDALTKLREAKIRPSGVTLTGTVLTIKLPDVADTQRALTVLAPMVQTVGAAVFTLTRSRKLIHRLEW